MPRLALQIGRSPSSELCTIPVIAAEVCGEALLDIEYAKAIAGDIELSNVQALVLEGRFPLEVLLGMSWLSRVRMDEQDNLLLLERKY